MRRNASAASRVPAIFAGSSAGPTIQNSLEPISRLPVAQQIEQHRRAGALHPHQGIGATPPRRLDPPINILRRPPTTMNRRKELNYANATP